jgi:hypothetical protein
MLPYEELKKNVRKFVSLTSLTPEEFDYLLPLSKAINKFFLLPRQKLGKHVNGNLVEVEKAHWRASNKNYCLP